MGGRRGAEMTPARRGDRVPASTPLRGRLGYATAETPQMGVPSPKNRAHSSTPSPPRQQPAPTSTSASTHPMSQLSYASRSLLNGDKGSGAFYKLPEAPDSDKEEHGDGKAAGRPNYWEVLHGDGHGR